MLGMWATLKVLIAMMIGGLGLIPGAIVGGLVLGVEVHSQSLFGPQVRDLAAYGVLFVLLVLRPCGSSAQRRSVRARLIGRGSMHDDLTGILSNIGVISFVALSVAFCRR